MSVDKFIQDGQDPKVVEKIYNKIIDMLTHGEAINYIAIQKKPAVNLLPDSIAISNKRIFLCEFTKLGLATNFEIFSWKDIKDIAFKEEIFGSKVTVIPFTGENLSIDYIPKVQARKLYQLIKEALENGKDIVEEDITAVVEKSTGKAATINEMYKQWSTQKSGPSAAEHQETNSASVPNGEPSDTVAPERSSQQLPSQGPVHQVDSPAYAPAQEAASAQQAKEDGEDELTLKLKKLKSLYDKQLITQAEYESKKSEILSQL